MQSLQVLANLPDPHLKQLCMKGDTTVHHNRPLGTFLHVALYREMTQASGSPDMMYTQNLLDGVSYHRASAEIR